MEAEKSNCQINMFKQQSPSKLGRISFFHQGSGLWRRIALEFLLAAGLVPATQAQETQRLYLSGHDKDDAVPWNFFCTTGAHSGYWTNLPVPSCWELHGFGTIHYHRDATNPVPETGLYQHDFTVPADWSRKRIFLVFDGVMTDAAARLNGQSVGPVHQGAYYRFKYEVTSLVKTGGNNNLEVTVAKHSADNSVNQAERTGDYWMYGGIFRPVSLEAEPAEFVDRVAVNAKADGSFALDVFPNGSTNGGVIEAQIQTLDGQDVGQPFTAIIAGEKVSLATQVAAPKLWTAETPNLYQVQVRLKENGQVVHATSQRFGFRTFEVRDGDGLYLNGSRVILKGCDRHSFWPDSGRCLSDGIHRLDIETLKDMNMNAVRMSHYPPDARFLDLCDEMGLYVLDELAGWHHYYSTAAGTNLVWEMVTRDVNHPSILFWDNGNEGGFNTNFDHLFGQFDPQQRRVLHPWATFSGVNTTHYLPYKLAKIAANGFSTAYHKNDYLVDTNTAKKFIYMPTEFNHGLYDGGAGAGLAEIWDVMQHSQYIGGGFIWAFLDEGVRRADNGQIDVSGNEAPDGIVGPYREREASFYAIKQIWSPVQVTRGSNWIFSVENRFSFTDLHDCKFSWQLRKFPSCRGTNSNFRVTADGVIESPSVPPGGTGYLDFALPAGATGADELALRVEDPHGRELWTWTWSLEIYRDYLNELSSEPVTHPAVPSETNGVITVNSGDMLVTFSKETGRLTGIRRGEQVISLMNGPRFTGGDGRVTQITFTDDGPDSVVSVKYDGALKSVSWRVNGNGWINCDYTYAAEGTNDYLGVLFDYPETLVKHKRWLGQGPYRVWQNRLEGTSLGVWENDYNNTITGWHDWIYPEFKGCFAGVRWLQWQTAEGLITIIPNHVPYTQVLTPEFPPANLAGHTLPPVPTCGLGLLDIIPPIGSKFQAAEAVCPAGQRGVAHGEYHGSVSFFFGPLP